MCNRVPTAPCTIRTRIRIIYSVILCWIEKRYAMRQLMMKSGKTEIKMWQNWSFAQMYKLKFGTSVLRFGYWMLWCHARMRGIVSWPSKWLTDWKTTRCTSFSLKCSRVCVCDCVCVSGTNIRIRYRTNHISIQISHTCTTKTNRLYLFLLRLPPLLLLFA